ncbi:sporulation stage III protein AG [Schnuerera sp. xch1]|uniref:sporulation stage III protein AG n=1 Tax=Schnuerera sp. xch1 TaxID=2874283 RepID=UPI001CBE6FE0|nr:sporulation stage III protein AG [Schnuerera sp. xch1]MBZ2173748.1 sporulation stage III protein AG [Schnuerera sp. xch1]
MDKYINKIKEYLQKLDNKELMRNLFIILIIGIILFILADTFFQDEEQVTKLNEDNITKNSGEYETDYSYILEKKLESILSQLKGVGTVQVMITLEDTTEKVPAFNTTKNNETTKELDSQGGTREIVREDTTIQIVTEGEGSPIVLKEIKPTIKGIIVIAEGAENLEVKEMLYEAVKTVLGISGNKVEVYISK